MKTREEKITSYLANFWIVGLTLWLTSKVRIVIICKLSKKRADKAEFFHFLFPDVGMRL